MISILDRLLFGVSKQKKGVHEALFDIENLMVDIPQGHFLMGSDRGGDDEFPIHNVMIDEFKLMKTLVTQKQWQIVMGDRPWARKRFVREGDDYPAVNVNYYDVARFISRLNQSSRAVFRLPTEAEWEYAARAGDWNDDLRDLAWFYENAFRSQEHYPHAVALKRPNPWGLFDMQGNVNEWCSDWYARNYYKRSPLCDPQGPRYGNKKMTRGGDWSKTEYFLRPTNRMYFSPHVRDVFIGFRLVKSIGEGRDHV